MLKYIFLFALLIATIAGSGQEFPAPMQPKRIVNDFTGLFKPQETEALEKKLVHFNDSSSTQIAIVTVPSIGDYDPNDYAQRLAEKWSIGQKGKNNGILILIKPKTTEEGGEVAIAVGYGLEGVVPDAIASRIIRNEIIPAFQTGAYYTGIDKAVSVLIDLTKGEYTADQYAKKTNDSNILLWLLLFFVFFILPFIIRRKNHYTIGSGSSSAIPPLFMGGGSSSRSFGSFSSGSGSFGGFGGGSFGGGGASGSW